MRQRGFTLIELLVVIVLMGAVMALVGPLGLAQIERSERVSEVARLEQLVKELSQKTFLAGRSYSMKLDGQVIYLTALPEHSSKQLNFKHLFFPAQQIEVFANGYYSADSLTYTSRGTTATISLVAVEGSDGQKR